MAKKKEKKTPQPKPKEKEVVEEKKSDAVTQENSDKNNKPAEKEVVEEKVEDEKVKSDTVTGENIATDKEAVDTKTNKPLEEKLGEEKNDAVTKEDIEVEEKEESKEEAAEEKSVTETQEKGNKEDKKAEEENDANEKKGRKSKKKKKEKEKIEADENKDGYVSAREVVNSLDKDIKVEEKSEDEILADHVAQQLKDDSDYFIFRIRKSISLVIVGLIILLLWVIPLAPMLKGTIDIFPKKESPAIETTPSPTPEVVKDVERIRIKVETENEKSASISALLKSEGYVEIDIQEVKVEDKGITVAVKKGDDDLRSKLMEILKDDYSAGSSSSELTSDSDFAAVVLMGE